MWLPCVAVILRAGVLSAKMRGTHGLRRSISMNLVELEAQLVEARARVREISQARSHAGIPREEIHAAFTRVYQAERALALAKGEETALLCEWEIPWDTGAPLPHVISSESDTYLIY